jgi:hypothetical protein
VKRVSGRLRPDPDVRNRNWTLDRVRDIDEDVPDSEAFREQVAEAADAECLGGVVTAGDEVHAGLARLVEVAL